MLTRMVTSGLSGYAAMMRAASLVLGTGTQKNMALFRSDLFEVQLILSNQLCRLNALVCRYVRRRWLYTCT